MPTRDPEATKERILAAAAEEFSAKGISGARVDAIADRARVNKRMLYYYFGSKEGLFREILRRELSARVIHSQQLPRYPPSGSSPARPNTPPTAPTSGCCSGRRWRTPPRRVARTTATATATGRPGIGPGWRRVRAEQQAGRVRGMSIPPS